MQGNDHITLKTRQFVACCLTAGLGGFWVAELWTWWETQRTLADLYANERRKTAVYERELGRGTARRTDDLEL